MRPLIKVGRTSAVVCAMAVTSVVQFALAATPAPAAEGTTTITLLPRVQIDHDAPIKLGQIATITGDERQARTLAAIDISGSSGATSSAAKASDPVRSIDLKAVRSALDAARVNWGRVTLKAGPGGVCEVVRPTPVIERDTDGAKRPSQADRFMTVDVNSMPNGALNVRQCVARRLAQHFDCEPTNLRLAFADSDQDRLETSTAGRRVEITLSAAASSARVSVGVVLYESDRVAFSGSFGVEAQVQRTVLVAAARIDRDQPMDAGAVRSEARWLSPSVRVLNANELSGRSLVAARRVNEGELLLSEHVESPIAARRGDIVWVHCLSGGISVRARCRAMQTARDGEVVTLRLENSKSTFQARMSGVGRAVKLADSEAGAETPAGTRVVAANGAE